MTETDLAAGVRLRALLTRKEKLLADYAAHQVFARITIGAV